MSRDTLTAALNTLAEELNQLRRAYERYWQGLERQEPLRKREALRDRYRALRETSHVVSNTGVLFRFKSAMASFVQFDELCTQRAIAIEKGTFARASWQAESGAASATKTPSAQPQAKPPADVGETRMQELYAQYVALQSGADGNQAVAPIAAFRRYVQTSVQAAQQKAASTDLELRLQRGTDGKVRLHVEPPPQP